jgi:DNA repair exonuclease SbcCD ATPase subunit
MKKRPFALILLLAAVFITAALSSCVGGNNNNEPEEVWTPTGELVVPFDAAAVSDYALVYKYRDEDSRLAAVDFGKALAAEKLIPRLKDLTEERSALAKKLASAEKKLEIILKTQEFLIETSNSLATEQLGATNRKFKGYLGAIDPTYISDTNLNISFEAARQEMGSTHPAESYSKGTRDLFEISTKLAISDSAFGKDKPFILLDDPFVYFDDGKLESAKRLLYSLSKDRQVLYFTASKFRGI